MTALTATRPAGGLETKFVALPAIAGELAESLAAGRIAGYASLFEEADQGGDIVAPGAFGASLARTEAAGRRVKFLWQHDPAMPIGVWTRLAEDARGLHVEGEILANVTRGADAIALLKAGAIDGLSIGYRTIRAAPSPETGGRRLIEIDLWEVSLVTFPLLPTARASLGAEDSGPASFEQALAAALAAV
ncbi:HK97 family phage prohead protease [Paralimibaculum aggregatum]|uniref:HK97 family phage prohead protease n=1 Tax=Paralimibaculum aggregatum TaxID=3036245 RepID=A0ABQ6LCY1_9RHOB|nr:HK97 family phage prohead protease [Limibaculum sp. NKW23]GMG81228.1 HK97 family phage prohead protease [Limibaculum sp. NKW23]